MQSTIIVLLLRAGFLCFKGQKKGNFFEYTIADSSCNKKFHIIKLKNFVLKYATDLF